MFMMTETAGEYLTAVLDNANASEETAIRFVLEGNTLTPKLDNAGPGDEKFDYAGRMVLILDVRCRKPSTIARSMSRRQMRDRSLSFSPKHGLS